MKSHHGETVEPSPEAQRAIAEARDARASNEAVLPFVMELSQKVQAQVDANHFLDLVEEVMHRIAG